MAVRVCRAVSILGLTSEHRARRLFVPAHVQGPVPGDEYPRVPRFDEQQNRNRSFGSVVLTAVCVLFLSSLMTGCALFYGSDRSSAPAVAVYANPKVIARGT